MASEITTSNETKLKADNKEEPIAAAMPDETSNDESVKDAAQPTGMDSTTKPSSITSSEQSVNEPRTSRETTPTQTQSPQLATPAAPTREPERNDAVTALQAMFPGMDSTIISEVLAAHGGDADAASMALLELNNPETAQPPARGAGDANARTAAAQLQADEEYARQLMLQMEQEHMQEYGRPLGSAPEQRRPPGGAANTGQTNYDNLNYVPRQRNRHGQPAGAPQSYDQHGDEQQGPGLGQWLGGQTGPDGRWKHQDELDQLTDQFNKIADTGKKTFNSFLSKAKDKYAQAAQQRAQQAQGSQQHPGAGQDSGIKIGGYKIPTIPSPWQGGSGYKPGEKPMTPEREDLRTGSLSPDTRSSVMRDYSQSPSRPGALDNRNSFDDDRPAIQINKPLPVGSQAQPIRSTTSTNAPTMSSPPATSSPGFSSSPAHLSQQHSRGSFNSGSPAKVQMLPRQTINLFDERDKERSNRSGSPAVAGGAAAGAGAVGASSTNAKKDNDYNDDDSDSDVEYVRNPFNDDD